MEQKPVVFVPVYNESANLDVVLDNLKKLQKEGVVGHILVIDDGSTDRTARIVKEHGADTVVRFPHNQGKAMAFFEAIKYYSEKVRPRPEKLIMLDADIKSISRGQIETLLKPLGNASMPGKVPYKNYGKWNSDWRKRLGKHRKFEVQMSIGTTTDESIFFSGQRAFLLDSFKPLLERKSIQRRLLGHVQGKNVKRGGAGLEYFLNDYFGYSVLGESPRVAIQRTFFRLGPSTGQLEREGRNLKDEKNSGNEILRIDKILEDRKQTVSGLKSKLSELSSGTGQVSAEKMAFIRNYLAKKKRLQKQLRAGRPIVPRPRKTVFRQL